MNFLPKNDSMSFFRNKNLRLKAWPNNKRSLNYLGRKKGFSKKKDKFIDRNGDGICDGRESAIGLKKMYRKRRGGNK